jgi:hypothetical protein
MTPRRVMDFPHCHCVFTGSRDPPSILSYVYQRLLMWGPARCSMKHEHLPLSSAQVKSVEIHHHSSTSLNGVGLKHKRNYFADINSGRNTITDATFSNILNFTLLHIIRHIRLVVIIICALILYVIITEAS